MRQSIRLFFRGAHPVADLRRSPSRALPALAVLALSVVGGCSKISRWTIDPWLSDYDTVERRAKQQRKPMLVVYRDGRRSIDDPLEKRLKASGIAKQHPGALRATLYQGFEPDRRYVAQFGVERAPAVIIVHADGTYHALAGTLATADLTAFAASAKPPGTMPTMNPLVPREAEYDWHATLSAAQQTARQADKPLLVVVTRAATRDWDSLRPMIERPEIHRRVRDYVHCHLDLWNPFARTWQSPWGALEVPAVILERPDGTHAVIEKPVGYEPIVRLIDGEPVRASEASASAAPSPAPN